MSRRSSVAASTLATSVLPTPGVALEQQRAAQLQREEERGGQAAVGDVAARREERRVSSTEVRGAAAGPRRQLRRPATARLAITVDEVRAVLGAGLAVAEQIVGRTTVMPSSASGAKRAASAFSIAGTRNTFGPAPVTATRTPAAVFATITPTSAYFEAWLANLA